MDRLVTRRNPLLQDESYQYDLNGNRTQVTDHKGQVTAYTYDALNRLTQITYVDNSTPTFTYNAANRITQAVDSVARTISYTYDNLDRVTSQTTPQGTISYTYDAAGRRTSMTVTGQSTINYIYDNANRLTLITQGSASLNSNRDIVQLLVARGADVNASAYPIINGKKVKFTALMIAKSKGNGEIIKSLTEAGAKE